MKAVVASSRFQPGEGPSRGLLRDYEPSDGTFSSTSEEAVVTWRPSWRQSAVWARWTQWPGSDGRQHAAAGQTRPVYPDNRYSHEDTLSRYNNQYRRWCRQLQFIALYCKPMTANLFLAVRSGNNQTLVLPAPTSPPLLFVLCALLNVMLWRVQLSICWVCVDMKHE